MFIRHLRVHTTSELVALGKSTVCSIVVEVSSAIIEVLWKETVTNHFPTTKDKYRMCMAHFEQDWQVPLCFGAVVDSHLPIKCPRSGQEAQKDYHNFKTFSSIVLMAIVTVSVGLSGQATVDWQMNI